MAAATDNKTIALNSVKGSYYLLSKDLEHLPEDAFDRHFGPKCRTVADIVCELNMVNDHIGLTIRGEKLFDWPQGWITAPEDCRDKAAVVAAFNQSRDKFVSMVEGFAEDEMLAPLQTDQGETNRFERCRFVALHNWYHSGQLNFIQTLLGDDQMHW